MARPPRGSGGAAMGSCASVSRVLFPTLRWGRCHLSGIALTHDLDRPTLRGPARRRDGTGRPCPGLHGLSARGVYQATDVATGAGGLLPHLFTLTPACAGAVSLSAALSVAPPFPVAPLPVRKHGALCCPDFPPLPPCGEKSGSAMHRMSMNTTAKVPHTAAAPQCRWMMTSVAPAP